MSLGTRNWQASDDRPRHLGDPPTFTLPDDFTGNTSWERAQRETVTANPVNDAEWMVSLSGSDGIHRVLWALRGRTLVADCDCPDHQYHDFCAHVAGLWWRWVRGDLTVTHLDTAREYRHPPSWLSLDDPAGRDAYDDLAPAQLDAYLHCQLGSVGPREWARHTGRAFGTVGNQLATAREKLRGGEQ